MKDITKSYAQVGPEIVKLLISKGYDCVQMDVLKSSDQFQALVELIPLKRTVLDPHVVKLDSKEISEYIGEYSSLTKYVVDVKYLNGADVGPPRV